MGWKNWGFIPRDISLFAHHVQTGPGAQSASYSMGTRGKTVGV